MGGARVIEGLWEWLDENLPPAGVEEMVQLVDGDIDVGARFALVAKGYTGRPPEAGERAEILAHSLTPPRTPPPPERVLKFYEVVALRDNPWPAALVIALGAVEEHRAGDGRETPNCSPLAFVAFRSMVEREIGRALWRLENQVREFGDHYDGSWQQCEQRRKESGGTEDALLRDRAFHVRLAATPIAMALVLGNCGCHRHRKTCSNRAECRCCARDHDLRSWEGMNGLTSSLGLEGGSAPDRLLRWFLFNAIAGIATKDRHRRTDGGRTGTAAHGYLPPIPKTVLLGASFDQSMLRDHLCRSDMLAGEIEVVAVEFWRCRECGSLWEDVDHDHCVALRSDGTPCDTADSRHNYREPRRNIIVLTRVYEPVERVQCSGCQTLFDPLVEVGGVACPRCSERRQVRCSGPRCNEWRDITSRLAPCSCRTPLRVRCKGPRCRRVWDMTELAAMMGRTHGCDRCGYSLLHSVQQATLQRCQTRTVRVPR